MAPPSIYNIARCYNTGRFLLVLFLFALLLAAARSGLFIPNTYHRDFFSPPNLAVLLALFLIPCLLRRHDPVRRHFRRLGAEEVCITHARELSRNIRHPTGRWQTVFAAAYSVTLFFLFLVYLQKHPATPLTIALNPPTLRILGILLCTYSLPRFLEKHRALNRLEKKRYGCPHF